MTSKIVAYVKVSKVIKSCLTIGQLESAYKLIKLFKIKYFGNEVTSDDYFLKLCCEYDKKMKKLNK